MKYTVGKVGRVFTMRFEDGDPIYAGIEKTAAAENIGSGIVWLIGGVKNGGVVVGPSDGSLPIVPLIERFSDPREIVGIGTLFPDDEGKPSLHLHASIGKGTFPLTGCPRKGLDCWLITEAILMETLDTVARRVSESGSGLSLLTVG